MEVAAYIMERKATGQRTLDLALLVWRAGDQLAVLLENAVVKRLALGVPQDLGLAGLERGCSVGRGGCRDRKGKVGQSDEDDGGELHYG